MRNAEATQLDAFHWDIGAANNVAPGCTVITLFEGSAIGPVKKIPPAINRVHLWCASVAWPQAAVAAAASATAAVSLWTPSPLAAWLWGQKTRQPATGVVAATVAAQKEKTLVVKMKT